MAREYTERPILASHTVKADDLNVEDTGVLRQINGAIDQNQVPLNGIGTAHLILPRIGDPLIPSYDGTLSTYGAASSYHRTTERSVDDTTPKVTIDPGTETAGGGWRSIADLKAFSHGVVLQFIAREGMIAGAFAIDVERRTSWVREVAIPTAVKTHDTDWIRFGVFQNGSLVADSGKITPRRLTVELPFAFPGPSGYCRLEVKFMQNTVRQIDDDGVTWSYPVVSDSVKYPPINFYSTYGWCRNQYR